MTFPVTVTASTGSFVVSVDPNNTVAQLKQTISVTLQLVITSFTLTNEAGVDYNETLTISGAGILENSKITVKGGVAPPAGTTIVAAGHPVVTQTSTFDALVDTTSAALNSLGKSIVSSFNHLKEEIDSHKHPKVVYATAVVQQQPVPVPVAVAPVSAPAVVPAPTAPAAPQ